MAGVKQGFAEA